MGDVDSYQGKDSHHWYVYLGLTGLESPLDQVGQIECPEPGPHLIRCVGQSSGYYRGLGLYITSPRCGL